MPQHPHFRTNYVVFRKIHLKSGIVESRLRNDRLAVSEARPRISGQADRGNWQKSFVFANLLLKEPTAPAAGTGFEKSGRGELYIGA